MGNTVETRNTIEQNPPLLQRQRSLEQAGDQTWQGKIIFVVLSTLRLLEQQSYLLSLIAMLVKEKNSNEYLFLRK